MMAERLPLTSRVTLLVQCTTADMLLFLNQTGNCAPCILECRRRRYQEPPLCSDRYAWCGMDRLSGYIAPGVMCERSAPARDDGVQTLGE